MTPPSVALDASLVASERATSAGSPVPQGATADERGVNFALFSEAAESVELYPFDSPEAPRAPSWSSAMRGNSSASLRWSPLSHGPVSRASLGAAEDCGAHLSRVGLGLASSLARERGTCHLRRRSLTLGEALQPNRLFAIPSSR